MTEVTFSPVAETVDTEIKNSTRPLGTYVDEIIEKSKLGILYSELRQDIEEDWHQTKSQIDLNNPYGTIYMREVEGLLKLALQGESFKGNINAITPSDFRIIINTVSTLDWLPIGEVADILGFHDKNYFSSYYYEVTRKYGERQKRGKLPVTTNEKRYTYFEEARQLLEQGYSIEKALTKISDKEEVQISKPTLRKYLLDGLRNLQQEESNRYPYKRKSSKLTDDQKLDIYDAITREYHPDTNCLDITPVYHHFGDINEAAIRQIGKSLNCAISKRIKDGNLKLQENPTVYCTECPDLEACQIQNAIKTLTDSDTDQESSKKTVQKPFGNTPVSLNFSASTKEISTGPLIASTTDSNGQIHRHNERPSLFAVERVQDKLKFTFPGIKIEVDATQLSETSRRELSTNLLFLAGLIERGNIVIDDAVRRSDIQIGLNIWLQNLLGDNNSYILSEGKRLFLKK